jgi:hypothetical protein
MCIITFSPGIVSALYKRSQHYVTNNPLPQNAPKLQSKSASPSASICPHQHPPVRRRITVSPSLHGLRLWITTPLASNSSHNIHSSDDKLSGIDFKNGSLQFGSLHLGPILRVAIIQRLTKGRSDLAALFTLDILRLRLRGRWWWWWCW